MRVEVKLVTPSLDRLVEQLVDTIAVAHETAPRAARAEVPAHDLEREDRIDRRQPRQYALELGDAIGISDAKDGPDDHLHRDRLRHRASAHSVASPPAVDLTLSDLLDQLGVVGDRVAVEGRQHQLAQADVTLSVEQKDRG